MRNLWTTSTEKIGSRTCIELKTTCMGHDNVEYCLASSKGEIWHLGGSTYTAYVLSARISSSDREEQRIRFDKAELEEWIRRLEIPVDPSEQTPHANGFHRK